MGTHVLPWPADGPLSIREVHLEANLGAFRRSAPGCQREQVAAVRAVLVAKELSISVLEVAVQSVANHQM